MGTRGLTVVIKNGEIKVAQYGQWDHYPEGQGLVVLEFLTTYGFKLSALEKNVDHCVFLTAKQEIDLVNDLESVVKRSAYLNFEKRDVIDFVYSMLPSLSRNTGAGILRMIADHPVPLVNESEFKNDKQFCEGVFTLNLDDRTFTTEIRGWEAISGKTVVFPFDNLPTPEQYLAAF